MVEETKIEQTMREFFWWLVDAGGEERSVCRIHEHCRRVYGARLQAAQRLAGWQVQGSWRSPRSGRPDVEMIRRSGRIFFRWIPHPELLEMDRRSDAVMNKAEATPGSGGGCESCGGRL